MIYRLSITKRTKDDEEKRNNKIQEEKSVRIQFFSFNFFLLLIFAVFYVHVTAALGYPGAMSWSQNWKYQCLCFIAKLNKRRKKTKIRPSQWRQTYLSSITKLSWVILFFFVSSLYLCDFHSLLCLGRHSNNIVCMMIGQ